MIKLAKSGLLTTIQDLGRIGYQKYGVIASGAMDSESHRIANLLVGNDGDHPTMEITLMGPVIEFQEDALIAICGGDLSAMVDGERVELWKPIYIKQGSELRFGNPKQGFRAYLAIAGGFDVPYVMNSGSTYLRAGIGGFEGRALEKGDEIPVGDPSMPSLSMMESLKELAGEEHFCSASWFASPEFVPNAHSGCEIRVTEGREFELFSEESQEKFFEQAYQIDSKSDRMGYRLKGSKLKLNEKVDMISEAVAFGTVQVPSEGNPIILLADRQTTGGYPKIAQVASVDLPKLAQLKPGEKIIFKKITHEQSQKLWIQREMEIKQLKRGIHFKYR
ncbi:5-oxoprolinase subunit C family protein [Halobacillus yeomjeoni]|uniref:5-oxoprolinase subunit C family protein n=1 Tax=Halobacillus yeomjeoni TaxID=311194 RepID=UPI0021E5ADA4|nr:biotin-dependent carboxyltransferase family protein [Halobacillus yeomjeoni]